MKINRVPKASPDALPELAAFLEPFAPLFRRHTSRDSMERYLTGLLTDLPHKTADTIAAAVAGTSTERLQHLLGAGIPTAGTGYELQAIAGAVIGGASLSGAKGRAIGAVLGAVIMGLLANGGNLLGIDPFYLQIAIGLLIILAVYFDHLQGRSINFLRRATNEIINIVYYILFFSLPTHTLTPILHTYLHSLPPPPTSA